MWSLIHFFYIDSLLNFLLTFGVLMVRLIGYSLRIQICSMRIKILQEQHQHQSFVPIDLCKEEMDLFD
jgi:hypothetical protein